MSSDPDLSGEWTGVYNYPVQLPPVAFEAVIQDGTGRISGTTSEVSAAPFGRPQRRDAVIDGTRDGHNVQFLKMYDSGDEGFDAVQYSGRVDPEGDEIGGTWAVAGLKGTFLMIRRSGAEQTVALVAEEKID